MITAQEAAKELQNLHGRFGSRFLTDGKFCASVVMDCLMPKFPIEAPLLAEAATRGVVDVIGKVGRGWKAQGNLSRIAADFARDTGHDVSTASWVVSGWAIAMGVTNSPLVSQPPQFPVPPPPSPYPLPPMPPVAPPHPGQAPVPPPPPNPPSRASHGWLLFVIGMVVAGVVIAGAREDWWRGLSRWIDIRVNREQTPIARPHSDAPRTTTPTVPDEPWSPPSRPVVPSSRPKLDFSSMSITILGNDISFNGQRIGRAQLQSLLEQAAEEDKNRSIEILYDESHETGQLSAVKEMCRKAGLRRLWVKPVDVR